MCPRDGNGNFTVYTPGNPVVTGTVIDPDVHNNTLDDIATELTNSIAADGQTVPTANLPMDGFKHTGAGDATASPAGQPIVYAQSGASLAGLTLTDTLTATAINASAAITGAVLATITDGATLNLTAAASNYVLADTSTTTITAKIGRAHV